MQTLRKHAGEFREQFSNFLHVIIFFFARKKEAIITGWSQGNGNLGKRNETKTFTSGNKKEPFLAKAGSPTDWTVRTAL